MTSPTPNHDANHGADHGADHGANHGGDPEPASDRYQPFSADGYATGWSTWDLEHEESLTLTWENEAWTAAGHVGRENVQYIIRLSPLWHVRQFILFRDLDQPDLWLGTDGHGRWGEMNGAHRPELDGPTDVALSVTPFTHVLPIRRLPLRVGDSARLQVLNIDVDTLGVVPKQVVYSRTALHSWRVSEGNATIDFDVDAHGVPLDIDGHFRSRQV